MSQRTPSQIPPHETIHVLIDGNLDKGLRSGAGTPGSGDYCVMQCLNLSARGLVVIPQEHVPEKCSLVDELTVTPFGIRLNDRRWSSPQARANGMRKFAHASIGSVGIDGEAWIVAVWRRVRPTQLPEALRAIAKLKYYAPEHDELIALADRIAAATDLEESRKVAREARDFLYTARLNASRRPNPYKVAAAVEAVAVVEAAAEAAVVVEVAEVAAVAAEVAEVAAVAAEVAAAAAEVAAEVGEKYWQLYWQTRDRILAERNFDQVLTNIADIAAEELEFAKAARDSQVRAEAQP